MTKIERIKAELDEVKADRNTAFRDRDNMARLLAAAQKDVATAHERIAELKCDEETKALKEKKL